MSPSMPSGHVFNDAEWGAVRDACDHADCWLLYDAAMDRILFDGLPHRIRRRSRNWRTAPSPWAAFPRITA